MQKFYADVRHEFRNGAIGWQSNAPLDCLGPFAKVQSCPIDGTDLRRTCYATGYADTAFSVPAVTRYKGQRVRGFFTMDDGAVAFVPYDSDRAKLGG